MAKENSSATGGIGFFGLLQIAFIVLKLCGVIEWSWVAVFIPVFAWVALVALIFGFGGICFLLANILDRK